MGWGLGRCKVVGILERIETKIDAIMSHLLNDPGPDPDPDPDPLPSKKTVLTGQDFADAAVGRWAPKITSGDGHQYRRMGYSKAVHAIMPDGRVLVKCHPYDLHGCGVCAGVSSPMSESALLNNVLEFGELLVPSYVPINSSSSQRGLLYRGDDLYATYAAYYAVSGEDYGSQSKNGEGCFTLTGEPVEGMSGPYHHNKVAGYLALPPEGMQADYLVGLCGSAGAGTTSAGPNLYAVNWNDGAPVAEMLVGYSLADDLVMPGWDNVTQIRGAAWMDTGDKHGVMFTGVRSIGHVWYGLRDSNDGHHDPWDGTKGYHAEDYDQGFWIFNPDDLQAGPTEWVSIRGLGWLDGVKDDFRVNHKMQVTCSHVAGRTLIGVSRGYPSSPYERTPLFIELGI